ncbi:MAG: hypothetical protein H6709_09575 [Kofleriaceae bacterium]|nr:hypothetical protein [Myxococcales bacterium]MCB9572321.1 hypothetical protein [Kofleriaceae bacterium]
MLADISEFLAMLIGTLRKRPAAGCATCVLDDLDHGRLRATSPRGTSTAEELVAIYAARGRLQHEQRGHDVRWAEMDALVRKLEGLNGERIAFASFASETRDYVVFWTLSTSEAVAVICSLRNGGNEPHRG